MRLSGQPHMSVPTLLATALTLIAAQVLAAAPDEGAARRAPLPERPHAVIVFDVAALDTLDALNVEVAGAPGANLPDYLGTYRAPRYAKVGTLFEPDYEAVAAAAPDLILIGPRTSARRAALSRIAPTVDLTIAPGRFIAGAQANLAWLGETFDRRSEAAALAGRIDAAAARVRALAPSAGRVLMIMVNGGKLTAFGAGSRFGWLHDELGLSPTIRSAGATAHGEVISFEYLLEADPDWLLVLDRDAAVGRGSDAARAVLDNDIVAATRAAKAGRILHVDPARWYISAGGGAATATILESLADALAAGGSGR